MAVDRHAKVHIRNRIRCHVSSVNRPHDSICQPKYQTYIPSAHCRNDISGTETPSARRTVTVLPADAAVTLFLTGSQSFCEATVTASVVCPSDTVTLPLTLPPFPFPSALSVPLSDEPVSPGVSVSGVSRYCLASPCHPASPRTSLPRSHRSFYTQTGHCLVRGSSGCA